ncbi:hypothetical protein MMC08_007022 [Hypocenomyce scalaris]|nr:hypothetical protein [Hypocenomyce scalaris]
MVCLSSFGGSAISAITMTIIQLNTKHEYLGLAASLASMSRNVGGAIGTTIYSSILANRFTANLAPDVVAPMVQAGVPLADIPGVITALSTGVGTSALAALTPTQLGVAELGLKWAHAHAFRTVFLTTLAFGILGLIDVFFVTDVSHQMTHKVEIKLEEGAHIAAQTDTGEGHFVEHRDIHIGHVHEQ